MLKEVLRQKRGGKKVMTYMVGWMNKLHETDCKEGIATLKEAEEFERALIRAGNTCVSIFEEVDRHPGFFYR